MDAAAARVALARASASIEVQVAFLMALMPIKMVLRWIFNLKYFIYLPEFNANL